MTFNRIWIDSHFPQAVVEPLVRSILQGFSGVEIALSESLEYLGGVVIPASSLRDFKPDLMVVIGGDGSLLRRACWAMDLSVPILGLHTGHLGFLVDISPPYLEPLRSVLEGNYQLESRMALEAVVGDQVHRSINEFSLSRVMGQNLMSFKVWVDNHLLYHQASDGLIVSTPTGSTAYALSAGGPIVQPGVDSILITPLCAHRLNTRPLIIKSDQEIRVVLSESAMMQWDGHGSWGPFTGEVLIRQCKKSWCLVHPKDHEFFKVLREKLHWESGSGSTKD